MKDVLEILGIEKNNHGVSTGIHHFESSGKQLDSYSPVNGALIGTVTTADKPTYDAVVEKAAAAFLQWRDWTAPSRGEIVRQIGIALREFKEPLGRLVSYEMGKSLQEGY